MPNPRKLLPSSLANPTGALLLSALLVVLAVGLLGWTSIGLDNDVYYHLNAGRYIVDQLELPKTSFFSYLEPPRSWIDYYWLFQTTAYLTQRALGDYGLVLLRAVGFLAVVALVASILERKRRDRDEGAAGVSILTAGLVSIYAMALLPRFASVRPHVSTLIAMTVCLFILECRPRRVWPLVIVTAIWMNFHGIAYPIMLLVIGAYALEIGARWFSERRLWTPTECTKLLWMLAAMAMMFLTPHGVRLIALPFRSIAVASRYILEIRPVDPSTLFSWAVSPYGIEPQTALNLIRIVAGIGVIVLASRRRLRIAHAVLVAGGLILLIKGARFEYHLTLLALPLVATLVSGWHDRERSSRIAGGLAALVVLVGGYSAVAYFHQQSELLRPYGAHGAPRGVARFLDRAGEGGRVLHHPNLGGYLAWELYPGFEVTADMQTPFVFSNVDIFHSVKVFNNEMLVRRALGEYDQEYIIAPLGNFGFARYITERAPYVPVFFDEISALYVNRRALPEVADTHAIRGLSLSKDLVAQTGAMDKDQARSALGDLGRMLELDPDGGLLHLLAARAYLQSGDPESASDHASRATSRLPGSHQAHAVAGDVYASLESWQDAARQYRKASARAPEDDARGYYRKLARSLAQLERYRAGYRAMLRAVDVMDSDTSRGDLFELGLSARSAGKLDEARDYLSFALLQTPPGDTEWRRRIEEALATVARDE